MRRSMLILALAALLAAGAGAATKQFPDEPLTGPRTAWWREGKFGMFIHWGIYAVPAGEWKGEPVKGNAEWVMHQAGIPPEEYEPLARRFKPVKFDADEWAGLAQEAGMKYVVITAKHHDGFSMYDSALTEYDVVDATPWGKDPMRALSAACRERGIRFCFYYSIMDWHHPAADRSHPARFPAYEEYMRGQVRELIEQYGPLGILWFDGQWIPQWSREKGRDLYNDVRALQPSIIINDRVGKRKEGDGDYRTPEQKIPAAAMEGQLWETCMTMNGTWGHSKHDDNWKSTADLVRKLIDIASKGGNFLLNVGPTAEGVIPAESVVRLRAIGAWMKTNSEAVYGTTRSPFEKHSFDGRCTVKGDTVYVHVFEWPKQGTVEVRGLQGEVAGVRPLDPSVGFPGYSNTVAAEGTVLNLSRPARPDPYATVIAVQLKRK